VRVLITGGAGFIGANVALGLADRHEVTAVDSLRRRGSELNLGRLREAGVAFQHADVRVLDDLLTLGEFDAILECSAEPSALAGLDGTPDYLIQSNLIGAYNCLELARRSQAYMVFLSTSRVYPVAALRNLKLIENETRLELANEQPIAGASPAGISEAFPLEGARTLYGTTKLSAELLIAEYRESFGLRAVINRCGVVAGPWQMGKVDQGVFTFWMLAHHFGRPLRYIGFGGHGKQVRDLLHVQDLLALIDEQLERPEHWDGVTVNVGGGAHVSLSLRETTELCTQITGRRVEIASEPETRPGDVPSYVSDCARLFELTSWRPRRDPATILSDIHDWIRAHDRELVRVF
jgi:CDP-paratose 2-epimerase